MFLSRKDDASCYFRSFKLPAETEDLSAMNDTPKAMTWEDAVKALVADPSQREVVESCYFDPPLSAAAGRYEKSAEWAAMRDIVGEARGTALDLGAGNGIVSYALAKDGWKTVAIEPDPSGFVGAGAIRNLARESGLEIDVREAFGEALPLADGSVQLVIARQVLHHARDLAALAKEIARVLDHGGLFLSTRDHVISGPDQLQPFLDDHPLHRVYGGENAYTRRQYRSALHGAGLTIEIEIGSLDSVINYFPYTSETLREGLATRCGPLAGLAKVALASDTAFAAARRILSFIDNRPGRLISFVCRKD